MKNKSSRTIKVLVFDEYPVFRLGLVHALKGNEPPVCRVCAETGDHDEMSALAEKHDPDVAIISLDSLSASALNLVSELRSRHPQLKVLALSRRDEAHVVGAVLKAGAKGYLNKSVTLSELRDALTTVLEGNVAVSNTAAELLLTQMTSGSAQRNGVTMSLSKRELEVLELTGYGLSRSEIADRLRLSTKTVDSYRARMKDKLGLRTMNELVKYAMNWLDNTE